MHTIRMLLEQRLMTALEACALPNESVEVTPTADARFGDYQTNVAMVLAKSLRSNPRQLAAQILEKLEVSDLTAPPEIAGAGFINFRLSDSFVITHLSALLADTRCGVDPAATPQTIIIDFSSPNVAKPMHVGHIRSTILGDCLARIARFLGHHVITDNHLGDWGTQFGKVIYGWKHFLNRDALQQNPVPELLRLYRTVNALETDDEAVRQTVREELVKLQNRDPENTRIWEEVLALSWREFEKMYALLDITFDERLGESFYHEALEPLVNKLQSKGIAEQSEGALCIFFRDVPDLADKPLIIQKRDGGYLYATTDLATLEYRIERWNPDQIWYVVGAPQALHFRQIFETANRMGLHTHIAHIAFGSILGEDRKMMKTRSGENVQLSDVLEEAITRAKSILAEKNPNLTDREQTAIAEKIGLGAVKYFELSQHRLTDYLFSWDKMLSFQGNTAPYLQNAYVRIQSIFRKLEKTYLASEADLQVEAPAERALAIKLMQFAEVVPLILDDFRPNLLANYLYELANAFHSFYEACPVLKATEPALQSSRLALCYLAARTLQTGLELLGIQVPERM